MNLLKNISFSLLALFISLQGLSAQERPITWGDQGDGTYRNPVLNADYSDPDVIRVGKRYYMVCSDFHYIGMPVLESTDMVNWNIISQVYNRFDYPGWDTNQQYAGGSWAPAIRYHDGRFWIFFCTPNEGLFMTSATDPHGPWEPLHAVKLVPKWEDPCPFWDEDGKAYLGRSKHGAGPIILHRMSADGRELLDSGVTVYTGPVAEGTKIHKRNGYYYISIPEGGVQTGWQTVLRSRNIYGPYERKVVLEQGPTPINGPHQGAFVETPEGELWFYHFQYTEPLGRVVHLQPAHWEEDWPVVGIDSDGNGVGEPVDRWKKPSIKAKQRLRFPQSSDEFEKKSLGLQWQWNHNPVNEAWSLTQRRGWMTLTTLPATNLRECRNMLTQKTMGHQGEAVTKLDYSALGDSCHAGLFCIGKSFHHLGVRCQGNVYYLYVCTDNEATDLTVLNGKELYLKVTLDAINNRHQLFYSTDGTLFTPAGDTFPLQFGSWKGARVGLFAYRNGKASGKAQFDYFHYTYH